MGDSVSSSVRYIFKVLIKLPCIILASYFVFNLFAFSVTYFRLLGFSYVVMQTAVTNNYIPPAERVSLEKYLAEITNTGVVSEAVLINTDLSSPDCALVKRQYGQEVTVGVSANYKWIWPLMPKDQLQNTDEQFIGYGENASTGAFSGFADEATLQRRREEISDRKHNIYIAYTVPGLKYYPDLN